MEVNKLALQIIYGRAGTGKTSLCLELIKDLASKGEKILFLTPEHISLQMERKIASLDGISGISEITVSGFSRLATSVFSKYGPVLPRFADDSLKSMLIKKILLNNAKKLVVLGKMVENTGFALSLLDAINSLKSAGITPDDLISIANSTDKMLNKFKLIDIAFVYEKYEAEFNNELLNSDDNLSLLCEKINTFDLFNGYYVFIDGFNGFSKQQYDLITVLLSKAKKVVVTCATDTLSDSVPTIFFRGVTVADKLFKICYNNSFEILPNIFLDKCYKFENNSELKHLECNLFKYPCDKYKGSAENISIYEGTDYYGEIVNVARNIYKLCRDNGYKYSDFAVVGRNMDTYIPIIKNVFSDYEIMHYSGEKLSLLKHPYITELLRAFDVIINNFSANSLIKWIKADFHNFKIEDVYLLENYIIASGSNEKMWQQPLKYNGGFGEKDFERVNEVYPEILKSILHFSKDLKGRKTFKSVTDALVKLLDEEYINKKYVSIKNKNMANSYISAYNSLIDLLNKINNVFGDFSVTTSKYLEILKSGLSAVSIGTIPATVDCVTVSEPDLYKEQKKVVFLIGANEGVIPKGYINDGLISENDKKLISANGFDAPDNNIIKHKAEDYLIYSVLTSPFEKLYVSYAASNFDGEKMSSSEIISNLCDIFPNISFVKGTYENTNSIDFVDSVIPTFNRLVADDFKENSDNIMQWYKENRPDLYRIIVNAKNFSNNPQKLREEIIKGLYGETPFYSISKIEKYNRCAFSYFMNYGLGAKPRRENIANVTEIGTIMHEVIEKYTLQCKEIGFEKVTLEMCKELVLKYTKEALINCLGETYLDTRTGQVNFKKIVNILNGVTWNITGFYKESKFTLFGSEVGFGVDGIFPPIEIPLKNGAVAKLTGKIDRVDILKADDRYYINVIDYKSGDKNINFGEAFFGVQIQLPVYIKAICDFLSKKENTLTVPAAMLYCRIDYDAVAGNRDMTEEEIKSEIQKNLRMKGLVVDTATVSESLGSTYCVKPDVTTHQIEVMCKKAYDKINSTINEIISGNINIIPANIHGNSSCTYCDYASVCSFDSLFGNESKYVKSMKKEEYFDYVGKMD